MQMVVKSKVKAEFQTKRYLVNTNVGRETKRMEVNRTGNTPYEV